MLLWHTLATYFRRKYGVRVQKIPLDAGATCPNRDGTLSARGCIFCNDSGSGSGMGLRGLDLRAQWDAWYTKYTTTDSDRLFMAYLQSFSNTYGPASRLEHLLEQVAALPGCRGIAVGTRPDCLDGEKLALLAGCGLDEVWLELGLQTCRDDTLRRINRGHTARQAEEAVRAALDAGLLVCGHLMAGLPGEDENDFLDGVDWAVSLGMQGLKLHNVYVPQGTELARQWRAGGYRICGHAVRRPAAHPLHRGHAAHPGRPRAGRAAGPCLGPGETRHHHRSAPGPGRPRPLAGLPRRCRGGPAGVVRRVGDRNVFLRGWELWCCDRGLREGEGEQTGSARPSGRYHVGQAAPQTGRQRAVPFLANGRAFWHTFCLRIPVRGASVPQGV